MGAGPWALLQQWVLASPAEALGGERSLHTTTEGGRLATMILAECEGVGVHKHPQTTCGVFGASMIGYQYQFSVFAPNIDMDTLKKGDAHTLSFESFEPFDQTGECND